VFHLYRFYLHWDFIQRLVYNIRFCFIQGSAYACFSVFYFDNTCVQDMTVQECVHLRLFSYHFEEK
jgi:hypothetical protein